VAAVLFSALAAAPRLYREKPPAAHTGGFGEPTCTACHLPEDNVSSGELRLLGLPPLYDEGKRYTLVVELSAPSLQVGGFQLAARFAEGPERGRQGGHFTSELSGASVARVDATGIEYVQHTMEGVSATRDMVRWRIVWDAPVSNRGPIDFHFVGNASNDDASPIGDRVLLRTTRTRPREP